jgi:transcriptional regulator with XRE-family HTH domain
MSTVEEVLAGRAPFAVLCGDATAIMATLPTNVFHVCYCDPPYGLSAQSTVDVMACLRAWLAGEVYVHGQGGFMGREWDAFVPGPEAWREVQRTLKPGGYCVAFSSTRTVDLLGLAVRLAGFEMREGWAYVGAQGFSKGLNVSKAVDRAGGVSPAETGDWLRAQRTARGLSRDEVAAQLGCTERSVADWEDGRARVAGGAVERITPAAKYRVKLMAWFGYPADAREEEEASEDRRGDETVLGLGFSGVLRSGDHTAMAALWSGYGTTIKPSYEPIVVARKPLDGTVADNVQKHGCGALNIDAGRIGTSKRTPGGSLSKGTGLVGYGKREGRKGQALDNDGHNPNLGRLPASLALVHDEECVYEGTQRVKGDPRPGGGTRPGGFGDVGAAIGSKTPNAPGHADPDGTECVDAWTCTATCAVAELGRQSGLLRTGAMAGGTMRRGGKGAALGAFKGDALLEGHGADQGTAARFFYQAKASAVDRLAYVTCSAGCVYHERATGLLEARETAYDPSEERPEGSCRACHAARDHYQHPTVKPMDLARYHTRLLSLPKHVQPIALVPYCGTGIEARALLDAGFRVVAIDNDPRHCAMTAHRLSEGERARDQSERRGDWSRPIAAGRPSADGIHGALEQLSLFSAPRPRPTEPKPPESP